MGKRSIILSSILGLLFLVVGSNGACSQGSCLVHDVCAKDSDCSAGLKCISCSSVGDMNYRCTRFSVTDPVSKVGGLPFNRYSWLTTHNSYAIVGEKSYTGNTRITFSNQEDSVTSQLNNGVRGLMLDMYDFENDIWLCHSFGGTCLNFTAFMPAIDTLKEIASFLEANPSEIITIFIEDYVRSSKGLTKVFTAAGLMKYWCPVSSMPQNGGDWPTVKDMVAKNERLIVFTSQSSKEASEGIAYEWKYVVENQYGTAGLSNDSCTNRAESKSLTSTSQSLFLENYFPDNPSVPVACTVNSDQLMNILGVCYENAGKRWANFLAVDFYKRSYGGGAFQAVDKLNGQLTCGCSDVTECQGQSVAGPSSDPRGPFFVPSTSLEFSKGPSTFTTDSEHRHRTSFTQLMMSDTPPHLRQSVDSGVAATVASSQPLTEGLVTPDCPRGFEVDLQSDYLLALELEKSLNKRLSELVRRATSSPLSLSTRRQRTSRDLFPSPRGKEKM